MCLRQERLLFSFVWDGEDPDPPPVQQSVGLPVGGSCEDVDAGLLEWAVKHCTGGDVCTRMNTFIRSSGTWAARLGVFAP
jgi:hypothetical protein